MNVTFEGRYRSGAHKGAFKVRVGNKLYGVWRHSGLRLSLVYKHNQSRKPFTKEEHSYILKGMQYTSRTGKYLPKGCSMADLDYFLNHGSFPVKTATQQKLPV